MYKYICGTCMYDIFEHVLTTNEKKKHTYIKIICNCFYDMLHGKFF